MPLRRDAGRYERCVGNDEPQIPPGVLEHPFEIVFEQRQRRLSPQADAAGRWAEIDAVLDQFVEHLRDQVRRPA